MASSGSVLVTRPEPDAQRTAERLAALGYHAIITPLLRAQTIDRSWPLTGFDAVAMTSARTIDHLSSAELATLGALPAFAVGARTAAAMRSAGFNQVTSADGDVEALSVVIAGSGLSRGSRIAHLGGEDRAGDLGAMLAPSGIAVDPLTVYRMVALADMPASARQALETGTLDAVLHYSPRSAEVFLDLARTGDLYGQAARVRHICLSGQVAQVLTVAFGGTISVARRPDEPALFDLLRS